MSAIFERGSRTAVAVTAFCLALAGAPPVTAQGKDEAAAPTGLEPPRIVAPLPAPPLPPEATDPSWLHYESGLRLFEEKRLGEALDSFKKAIAARADRSDEAVESIEAALSERGAVAAKDSIRARIELLASRDLSDADLASLRARSAGSLTKEMSLIAERRPSGVLDEFIRAAKLVIALRGGPRVGDSLDALLREARTLRYYPEAEYAIGRIYLAEGELGLAESQIRRAVDMAESLDVVEERYAMLEALAEVYRTGGKQREYELTLREVADASDLFSDRQSFLRAAMERTLERDGIDKFMLLYRLEEGFPRTAFSKLGSLYLERGRPVATIYLAASVNIVLSDVIASIRAKEPSFVFVGMRDLTRRVVSFPTALRYVQGAGLFRDMTLLGEALALVGARDQARDIWKVVAALPEAAPWNAVAADALSRPAGATAPYPRQSTR